ncbi:TPA: hypothetical protein ACH3X2_012989 [Trebouxia sp. C0005]
MLRVRANKARAAYMAAPDSHHALDALRDTAAALLQHRRQQAATDALRAGVLLHEYGDQSTYCFHHLHRQRQQATVINHLKQQQGPGWVVGCERPYLGRPCVEMGKLGLVLFALSSTSQRA